MLIGTHAFLAFGNMLGVRWGVQFANTRRGFRPRPGKQMAIALPTNLEMDVHAAIDSLQMGFLPAADLLGAGLVQPT